ncbi:hypothetical protein HN51_058671 [Arachis hypogaea]
MDENSHDDGGVADDDALDEYEMLTKVTDTSAAQARKGKDIQGIQERCRSKFCFFVSQDCKRSVKGGKYYDFFYNTRMVKPTILHF